MKQASALLARFNRLAPAGITPKFTTVAEWQAWQQAEGRRSCEALEAQNRQARSSKLLGRSGIRQLHQRCTFSNYQITCEAQQKAYSEAKSWLANSGTSAGGFVFSGTPGTGKNHLAAAIGNQLIAAGKTVLIVTVADLMTQLRACYDGSMSEATFLDGLCDVDLLIIDEVGVQRDTQNERIILNQIIDRRTSSLRPVGILTNLNHASLAQLLGERVMDRLKMNDSIWVNFTWGSFRSQVRTSLNGNKF